MPIPSDRPYLTDEQLAANGIPGEEWEHARAEHLEFCEHLEARGPIHLDFGGAVVTAMITGSDIATDDLVFISPLTGTIDISTYRAVQGFEGFHVDPEAIASQPIGALGALEFRGASDELIAAIANFTDTVQLSIDAVFDQAAYDEMRGFWADPEHNAEMTPLPDYVQPGGSVVTDRHIRDLKALSGLVTFSLYDSEVTDAAYLDLLPALPHLIMFSIGSTSFTGAGLAAFASAKVETINVDSDALSGAAVSALPELPSVLELRLCGRGIFDGLDIADLNRIFPNLQMLQIGRPEVFAEEDLRLRMTFPDVEINGAKLSRKAIEKLAAKQGIAL